MAEHTYTGIISFGFSVSADRPLTTQEIIDQIATDIPTFGIPECDLGDIEHYIDEELFNSPESTCPKCFDDYPTEDLNYATEDRSKFMLCPECLSKEN